MKNVINREVPQGFTPFNGSNNYKNTNITRIKEKQTSFGFKTLNSYEELFDALNIKDGMTLSFHHHLRNGDFVLNEVLKQIKKRNLKNMALAPSSIFPTNEELVELINGLLQNLFVMYTHGGRPVAIESGALNIDVAILSVPTVDKFGNGTGVIGKSACGSLGYAVSDLKYAKKVVLVTDNLVDEIKNPQLDGKYVDYVLKVDAIGDPKGIVSGTTKITKDPVGLKIARLATALLDEIGFIKDGMSM